MLKKRRRKRRPKKQKMEVGMELLLLLKMNHQNLFLMNQKRIKELQEIRTMKRTLRDLGLLPMKTPRLILMLQKR
uniref:Uncharacterized protein n=1 Tax=Arundo donax TaxID=35708 RepID=A0A0A9CH67_ARUDO